MKKNGTPKSRTRKNAINHPCGCFHCTGTTYDKIQKLKTEHLLIEIMQADEKGGLYDL